MVRLPVRLPVVCLLCHRVCGVQHLCKIVRSFNLFPASAFSSPADAPIEISSGESDNAQGPTRAHLRVLLRPETAAIHQALHIPALDGFTTYSLHALEAPWP